MAYTGVVTTISEKNKCNPNETLFETAYDFVCNNDEDSDDDRQSEEKIPLNIHCFKIILKEI